MTCHTCGHPSEPDGQLQCKCNSTGAPCPDCVKLLEKVGELSTRLESERQQRIEAEQRAARLQRDADMLARLCEEMRKANMEGK